jgi:hypothetical protein
MILPQLWKGRAVKDALPGEESGAVKFECQEKKMWQRVAQTSGVLGAVWVRGVCVVACSDHVSWSPL